MYLKKKTFFTVITHKIMISCVITTVCSTKTMFLNLRNLYYRSIIRSNIQYFYTDHDWCFLKKIWLPVREINLKCVTLALMQPSVSVCSLCSEVSLIVPPTTPSDTSHVTSNSLIKHMLKSASTKFCVGVCTFLNFDTRLVFLLKMYTSSKFSWS